MLEIQDYFKQGILVEVFQAKRNLFIWESMIEEIDFLATQKKGSSTDIWIYPISCSNKFYSSYRRTI